MKNLKAFKNFFLFLGLIILISIGFFLIKENNLNIAFQNFFFKNEFKKEENQLERLERKEELESKLEIEEKKPKEAINEKKKNSLNNFYENQFLSHPLKLENPPSIIRALYVTPWSISSKYYLDYLVNLFKITEINAIVLDIKDYSGFVSYPSQISWVKDYNLTNYAISDIDNLISFFHQRGIYVIGRITVFQDPALAKKRPDLAIYDKEQSKDFSNRVLWHDNKNLFWVDPASKEVWEYNVLLAKDAFLHGFDEINFDYVRFPSDGNFENMGFPFYNEIIPYREVIKEFFKYIRENLPEEKISVDLFGLSTVSRDDLGIGQIIEDALEFFDYVCPMVYPSHYASGFGGFPNPAEFPYEVVKYSLESALLRKKILESQLQEKETLPEKENLSQDLVKVAEIRPWLQDFNLGAKYTAQMVKQEIQAVIDALKEEFRGFMLWNPSNIYTQEAILKKF